MAEYRKFIVPLNSIFNEFNEGRVGSESYLVFSYRDFIMNERISVSAKALMAYCFEQNKSFEEHVLCERFGFSEKGLHRYLLELMDENYATFTRILSIMPNGLVCSIADVYHLHSKDCMIDDEAAFVSYENTIKYLKKFSTEDVVEN